MEGAYINKSRAPRIKVKFLFRTEARIWLRQFPDEHTVWGDCQFLLDPAATEYDWLVVYNDLPSRAGERFSRGEEPLACPRAHTMLITTEPSAIKYYGELYTAQFGCVLTSQEPWALPHPHRIYSQPALFWFYGLGANHIIPYRELAAAKPPVKSAMISTVCSSKRQRHTLHSQRVRLVQALQARMPELEVFGHGVRRIDDKAEALDPYRYHITVENQIALHHWSEKLADAYLGYTLPFYAGCPNAADYFPEESFIFIDPFEPEAAYETITRAMRDGAYEKRLPAILEARRRVLEEHNMFALLAREITARHTEARAEPGEVLYSRRLIKRKHPAAGLAELVEKYRRRVVSAVR